MPPRAATRRIMSEEEQRPQQVSEEEGASDACADCDAESCEGCESFVDPFATIQDDTHVRRVIGVVSGKGGVGKSLVTSILASTMKRRGHEVGVLDTDATGPSIPRMIGVSENMKPGGEETIIPAHNDAGIKIMSVDLALPDATEPVIWRGPVISGIIKQFWCDTHWGDLDFMFIDMPPGTSDVALTVFQHLPVDGIVVVATPQDLVQTIATKAIRMAEEMEIPVVALVENMSYVVCPDCGRTIKVFGESGLADVAEDHGIDTFVQLPFMPELSAASDASTLGESEVSELEPLVRRLEEML
jgi:Mrp family chromosome partitioning ATPase